MPAGRPTKLTPEIAEKIFANLRLGAPRATACLAEGVTVRTFYRWLKVAENENIGNPLYEEFSHNVNVAEAKFELECLENLRTCDGNFARWAWLLERRRQATYGGNPDIIRELRKLLKFEEQDAKKAKRKKTTSGGKTDKS
jgi:hypothetical protein